MKTNRKKKLKIAAVLLMFFSVFFSSKLLYAEETQIFPGSDMGSATQIQYGENGYYAQRTGLDEEWFSFMAPDVQGYTTFYIKNTSMDRYVNYAIYSIIEEKLDGGYVYKNDSDYVSLKLEPGQMYYICITGGTDGGNYIVSLSHTVDQVGDTPEEATKISANQDYTWSIDGYEDKDYGYFIPSKTGKHKFYCKNNSINAALKVRVYVGTTEEELYNEYIYNNSDKSTIFNLEAGKKYYFYFGDTDYKTGLYSFNISDQGATGISLNKSKVVLKAYDTYQLNAAIEPKLSFDQEVEWSSSNTSVAEVNDSGYVKAYGTGKAIITCTVTENRVLKASCTIIVTPGTVENLYVDSNASTNSKAVLRWNGITGASGYTIYCYDKKTKKWLAVKTAGSKATSATISKIKSNGKLAGYKKGTGYQFKIAAYIKSGTKKYLGSKSQAAGFCTAPGKASITSIRANTNREITLKWKKVSGASGYYIYRKSSTNGSYTYYTSVSGGNVTSYKTSVYSSGKYSYKISAYKKSGSYVAEGKLSKGVLIAVK